MTRKFKSNQRFKIILVLSLVLKVVTCFPKLKANAEFNTRMKDEKHYPNGTIIGKYEYVDKEGNPVQVKYYADNSSYGVEMKSVKVLETSSNAPLLQAVRFDDILDKEIEPLKLQSNLLKINYDVLGSQANSPYKYFNKEISQVKTFKGNKANADYEIFYQKELKAPKKCKDKVRVFFDKEKRWARNVNNEYDACDSNV